MSEKFTLIIDDDPIVREAVKDILELIEVNVLEASNGIKGVELFEEHSEHVSLIILDMIMPGMNGYDVLQKVRSISPAIRVIMSSGLSELKVENQTYPQQPDEYLFKPYELDMSINSVKKYY